MGKGCKCPVTAPSPFPIRQLIFLASSVPPWDSTGAFAKISQQRLLDNPPAKSTNPLPAVEIELEEDWVYVLPLPEGFPTNDPVLRGTVFVSLPVPTALSTLSVVLEGLCEAYGGDEYGYESSVTLRRESEEDLRNEVFEAGRHAYVGLSRFSVLNIAWYSPPFLPLAGSDSASPFPPPPPTRNGRNGDTCDTTVRYATLYPSCEASR